MKAELGNTPADKDYKPSGIVNDLTGGQIKAVQLKDGTFITENLAKEMAKEERRASKYEEVAREMRKMVEPEELDEMAHLHVQKTIDTAGHPGWDWEAQDIVDAYKAGWHFRDNSLNWVRDLVDYGIKHPEDAVEYLKRIKDLLK